MLTGLLVIPILASLTCYLLFRQRQLRLAGEAQSRFSDKLINAQELERSLVAAELHDNISARPDPFL